MRGVFTWSSVSFLTSVLMFLLLQLWDVMTEEKAFEICGEASSAEGMARRLLQTALNDSKCNDNVTVIVALL